MTHVSLAVYLIEAGLILIVGPWTALWQRNYFAYTWPWLGTLMMTASVRAVVVGTGIATVVAGMTDLRAALSGRLSSTLDDKRPVDEKQR